VAIPTSNERSRDWFDVSVGSHFRLTNMVSVLLAAICLYFGQSEDLLARSQLLAVPQGWAELHVHVAKYTWLTPHELLYRKESWEWSSNGITKALSKWFILEVQSSKTRPLSNLDRSYEMLNPFGDPQPDPTGKLLLWTSLAGNSQDWVLTNLKGACVAKWPRKAMSRILDSDGEQSLSRWSPDGKSITEAELRFGESPSRVQVWRRELGTTNQEQSLPDLMNSDAATPWAEVYDDGNGDLIWIQGPGWVDAIAGCPPTNILVWPQWSPDQVWRKAVQTPNGDELLPVEPSPDRKRLLWERFGPDQKSVSILVSRIDGRAFLELGTIRFSQKIAGSDSQHFGECHWIPGGKAVSHVFIGTLYSVPATGRPTTLQNQDLTSRCSTCGGNSAQSYPALL
jgi:hypothetical protein